MLAQSVGFAATTTDAGFVPYVIVIGRVSRRERAQQNKMASIYCIRKIYPSLPVRSRIYLEHIYDDRFCRLFSLFFSRVKTNERTINQRGKQYINISRKILWKDRKATNGCIAKPNPAPLVLLQYPGRANV